MKNQVFHENVVIITGASYGIGEELALQLADQGAWLALAARNEERLNDLAARCIQRGGKAIIVPTDVADEAQCRRLIERTVAEFGRIDTLINNAGFGIAGNFGKMKDLTLFEKIMQVNFMGSVYCTFYALPHLKATRGRLVGVSSLRGKLPSGRANGYGASKHAMAGFFDSLRNELTGSGVTVTMIYPGWVSTGISSRAVRPDGSLTGKVHPVEKNAMSVETCTRIMIQAAAKRKREVVMTLLGKAGVWLRLIAPGFVDRLTRQIS